MDREQIANAVLWPIDRAVGLSVAGLEKTGLLDKLSGAIYYGLKTLLRTQFQAINGLEIEGIENIPDDTGVILASNHQSWLDVQVLGAASPRRVHFVAKNEFRTWPGLRHLVKMTESVFINRGGDRDALAGIVEHLKNGWAVGMYPEGTIPGEEDIGRSAVQAETGLLQGRSGVARLALEANVPIVPVGVSGTGRALPPEVYPRLEILRLLKSTPIRIRFGKPIDPGEYRNRERNRELYREITDRVMREISGLVDHQDNYIPLELPIEPIQPVERLGVLVLHGFTSHLDTVNGLIPHLQRLKLDWEMPVLRGHGTQYQDLAGVRAGDWFDDAQWAFTELLQRVDKVIVVGLSMGGLLALDLGMHYPERVAAVVTVAAALRFTDPMARFSQQLGRVVKFWPSPNSFNDPELKAERCRNYPKFAVDSFASLYSYAQDIERRLDRLTVPLCILQSKRDQIVAPESANIIYERVSSRHREILWYSKSGHEMMQDLEAKQVLSDIAGYIGRFQQQRSDSQQP
ncbi:MAG: alpha/beta fold hydrolase [Bradymonadales bacterium]|nr:alpha/beta fold hydrolase [Bradymonadales bacterium]